MIRCPAYGADAFKIEAARGECKATCGRTARARRLGSAVWRGARDAHARRRRGERTHAWRSSVARAPSRLPRAAAGPGRAGSAGGTAARAAHRAARRTTRAMAFRRSRAAEGGYAGSALDDPKSCGLGGGPELRREGATPCERLDRAAPAMRARDAHAKAGRKCIAFAIRDARGRPTPPRGASVAGSAQCRAGASSRRAAHGRRRRRGRQWRWQWRRRGGDGDDAAAARRRHPPARGAAAQPARR
ncbi:Uncharacterised protein [Burkholderia pseudomallei]|nr:Uncharacterised protein [Burkholderia pseudomallei]CAJ9320068.1 Uncharacterised protein [Burkholderia pseudomallei]